MLDYSSRVDKTWDERGVPLKKFVWHNIHRFIFLTTQFSSPAWIKRGMNVPCLWKRGNNYIGQRDGGTKKVKCLPATRELQRKRQFLHSSLKLPNTELYELIRIKIGVISRIRAIRCKTFLKTFCTLPKRKGQVCLPKMQFVLMMKRFPST